MIYELDHLWQIIEICRLTSQTAWNTRPKRAVWHPISSHNWEKVRSKPATDVLLAAPRPYSNYRAATLTI